MFKKKKADVDDIFASTEVKSPRKISSFAVVLISLVMLGGLGLLGSLMLGGKRGESYYDIVQSVFDTRLGQFSYTLEVQTDEAGVLNKDDFMSNTGSLVVSNDEDSEENSDAESGESDTESGESDTESGESDTESGESDTTAAGSDISSEDSDTLPSVEDYLNEKPKDTGSTYQFSDWEDASNIKIKDWKYPKYKVTLTGVVNSLEPYDLYLKIGVATEGYNNTFTTLICKDDTYYLDIEAISTWLANSSDNYLIGLGSNLSTHSKWLKIPKDKLTFTSRFAETSEESYATVTGVDVVYSRVLVLIDSLLGSIKDGMGTTGLSYNNEVVNLNIDSTNANKLAPLVSGLGKNTGSLYKNYVDTCKANGYMDDTQYTQALRETDNIVTAFSKLSASTVLWDVETSKPKVNGTARRYKNNQGSDICEADLVTVFTINDKDYYLHFNGSKISAPAKYKEPEGSMTDFTPEMWEGYKSVYSRVLDYFNITSVNFANTLEINPDSISEDALDSFITLVNSMSCSDMWLTRLNVKDYIVKWSSPEFAYTDSVNATLVRDFLASLEAIKSGVSYNSLTTEDSGSTEKHPNINISIDGVDYLITYNEDESNSTLVKLDVVALNTTEENKRLSLADFSIKTLLGSTHPANNKTILLSHNNVFDVDNLLTEVDINAGGYAKFPLYFVTSSDRGHMDLFLGEETVGVVIEY